MADTETNDVVLVNGIFALPPFTQPIKVPAHLPVLKTEAFLADLMARRYEAILGVKPKFESTRFLTEVQRKNPQAPALRDYQTDPSLTSLPLIIVYDMKEDDVLVKLHQDAAQGREALVENVVLKSAPSSSKKKGKGKGATATESQMAGQMAELMRKIERMEISNGEEIQGLKSEIQGLKSENKYLVERVTTVEKTLQKLHRRIILDQARDKVLETCQLDRNQFATPELLLSAVKTRLPASPPVLSVEALDLIFLSNRIRDEGNVAAHEARHEDVGIAILSSSLTEVQRMTLREVYEYMHSAEPMLGAPL
ncbi:hypothetical protein H0H87_012666 [Tephrocybe sp. NHM501043]|nr:hypothetical protein H0H87_012666 [Tephrocybe sp. NHM501043]